VEGLMSGHFHSIVEVAGVLSGNLFFHGRVRESASGGIG
jgi:hypothetical protein